MCVEGVTWAEGDMCTTSLLHGQMMMWDAFHAVQVQHVYALLQKSGGGTRRAALAELRLEYESSLRFSGKV